MGCTVCSRREGHSACGPDETLRQTSNSVVAPVWMLALVFSAPSPSCFHHRGTSQHVGHTKWELRGRLHWGDTVQCGGGSLVADTTTMGGKVLTYDDTNAGHAG